MDGEECLALTIQDQNGEPLPGVVMILNCDYGPLLSDADGVVTVPRIAMTIDLALNDARYCVLNVETSGTIESAPDPVGDSARDWADTSQQNICHRTPYEGTAPASSLVDWSKHWINMPYFDAAKGSMTITVGVCEE